MCPKGFVSIAIVGLGLMVAAVPAVAQKGRSTLSSTNMTSEYGTLAARSESIEAALRSSDAGVVAGARADWDRLLVDLDAWAARHRVATSTRVVDGTLVVGERSEGGGDVHCPQTKSEGTLECYFTGVEQVTNPDGSVSLRCVYKCYSKPEAGKLQ